MTHTSTRPKPIQTLKIITAKYGSRCRETKQYIKAGDKILFNPSTKMTYCQQSNKFLNFLKQ